MENMENMVYTYQHRKAFTFVVTSLLTGKDLSEMLKRARVHDMDKMVMYTVLPKEKASELHRSLSSHHVNNDMPKDYYDYLEMVIDWECAGLTKADKPLNAFNTLNVHYPELKEDILPILKKLEIDLPYDVKDKYSFETGCPGTFDVLAEVTSYLITKGVQMEGVSI